MNKSFCACTFALILSLLFASAKEFPNVYMELGSSTVETGKFKADITITYTKGALSHTAVGSIATKGE